MTVEVRPVLAARGLTVVHRGPDGPVTAVRGAVLDLVPGRTVALTGRSGSGKTSLLTALGLLAVPTAGTVLVDGRDTAGLSDAALSALRRDRLGFVFQSFHLLPQFTATENVALAHPGGLRRGAGPARLLLNGVGLGHRLGHRPRELSAGEQQRVALARALVNRPAVLLADEPTGNLDAESASAVLDLLTRSAAQDGCAVLLVTHSAEVAARADRVLEMADGVLGGGAPPALPCPPAHAPGAAS
ncbi:ABC transporter ATP-binding protein [Streptomyces sp. NPDC047968]|uniref:ABC transporter ATP-binding protein n=1 Tax=unclassified Streptomyces TaxID=2593676 RepID=UPI0034332165